MFERLSQQLQQVLRRFRGIAQLDERALEEPLRELRRALLSADVHVEVVESFLRRIRERALGLQLPAHQLPEQALLRIVYEELRTVLGTQHVPLRSAPRPPTKVLLVGLQGAGKTTTTAKLAAYLHRRGQHPLVVAADLRRPAACRAAPDLGRADSGAVCPSPRGRDAGGAHRTGGGDGALECPNRRPGG
jgi:signal recognition particle subunit SRP54